MLVIPAIDLKNGEVVRLLKGDFNKKISYSESPEKVAKTFEELGAKYIHIVDLDGARDEQNINLEVIKQIRQTVNISLEVGGGIRDDKKIKFYLEDLNIDRVVLGTAAIKNPEFIKRMINKYGEEKIVISVDVKNGSVMTSGWEENSKVNYIDFIKTLENIGVKYIEVTDISKDGTLDGPNFEIYKNIKENTNMKFVVSGGIKNIEDIKKINDLDYYGCIVGKAYYEGKVDLKEVF